MKFEELITVIYKDERYLKACKNITNNDHRYFDLWHDTITELYLSKEGVITANNEGSLFPYVIRVILNVWSKRFNVRKIKGNTSNLYMYCDNQENWSEYKEHVKGLSGNERYIIKQAVTELNKKIKSKEQTEAENGQLVWDVCNSNVWQVSKRTGVNHMKIKRTFVKTINQIKRKLDE